MTSPVFYVDSDRVKELQPGETFVLGGAEGHHAKNVKRIGTGELLDLADGQGRRFRCEVTDTSDAGLQVIVKEIVDEKTAPRIYLVQALAKNDRDLLAIEMATELGVSGVVPWQADRSIVQWKKERATKAHAKWEKTVVAAAKQARRALIPTVAQLHSSNQLVEMVAEAVESNALVFVLHEQENNSLVQTLKTYEGFAGDIYVLVGPEGGVSDREIDALTAAGAVPAVLGQQILRSSTAGAAALSAFHAVMGDW